MNETRMLATTTTSRSIDLPSQSGFANIPCKSFENYETFHQKMYHQIDLVRKLQVNSDMSNKEKDEEIKECKRTIDTLNQNLMSVKIENERLKKSFEHQGNFKNEVFQRAETTIGIANIIKEHVYDLELKIESYEKTRELVAQDNEAKMNILNNLKIKIDEIEAKKCAELLKIRKEIETKDEHSRLIMSEYERKIDDMKTEASQVADELKVKNQSIKEMCDMLVEYKSLLSKCDEEKVRFESLLAAEIASKDISFNRIKGENEVLDKKLQQLQERFNEEMAKNSMNDAIAHKLKLENETLNEQLKQCMVKLNEEKTSYEFKLNDLKSENQSLTDKMKELMANIDENKSKELQMEIELNEKEKRIRELENEMKIIWEMRIESERQKEKEHEEELSSLKSKLDGAINQREEMSARVDTLSSEQVHLNNVLSTFENVKKQLSTLEVAKKEVEAELKVSREENDEQRALMDKLQAEKKRKDNEIADLKIKLAAELKSDKLIDDMKERIDEQNAEIIELKLKLKNIQQSQPNSQICNENRLQRISEQLKRKRFVLATIGDNNNGEGVLFKMNDSSTDAIDLTSEKRDASTPVYDTVAGKLPEFDVSSILPEADSAVNKAIKKPRALK